MKVCAKDQARGDRPAAHGKRTGPDRRKQNADARPVFIDLDDAYGVPFSAADVSLRPYGEKEIAGIGAENRAPFVR